ncbi:MAG TPA: hypothetical protein VIW29_13420 [Polyangiaceae bacterium]
MNRKRVGASLILASVIAAAPARAEEWTRKSFLMPDGSFELTGDPARPTMSTINTSSDAFAQPVTLAPHLYWAASDDLSLGISHETGLCLNDCDEVYNDVGFDMMYFLVGSRSFELDLHVGAPIKSFDPFVMGAQAGVIGRVNFGSVVALVFDPALYVGFTRRDQGNREYLSLPFWFYFQATSVIVPFVGSSVAEGPLDGLYDDFALPLEAGMLFDVTHDIDVGFSFRFPRLVGENGTGAISNLSFLGRFRF